MGVVQIFVTNKNPIFDSVNNPEGTNGQLTPKHFPRYRFDLYDKLLSTVRLTCSKYCLFNVGVASMSSCTIFEVTLYRSSPVKWLSIIVYFN